MIGPQSTVVANRLTWLSATLWALGLVCASGVTTFSVPGYAVRIYQTEDGLPANNLTSVVQTRDGYLWLGTRKGLVRFDGVRFTVFDSRTTPEIRAPHVSSLYEDSEGVLWIGYLTGEVLSYRQGVFRQEPIPAKWAGGKIFAFATDAGTGDLWALNQAGELASFPNGTTIPGPATRSTYLLSMSREPGGRIWLHRENEVLTLEQGDLRPLEFTIVETNRYIQGVAPSPGGGLWILNSQRIKKWRDEEWVENWPVPWGDKPIPSLLEIAPGLLSAGTADHGLYLISQAGFQHLCRTNGLSDDWVTSQCLDREGNLWVTLGNGGLAVLRPVNLVAHKPPDEWQGRAVLSVTHGPRDELWVGTEGAGLYKFQGGTWTNFDTSHGLPHRYIWSVALDSRGQVWAGSWGSGVFVQKAGEFEVPTELRHLTCPITALLPDADGMLVGGAMGLLRWDAGRVTWLARKPEISADVCCMAKAADGAVWFGMSGGGLGCWKDGKLRQYRRADGLVNEFVQCLRFEANGTLWIGTFGGGLVRFKDGRFAAVTREHGLPSDVICDVQGDEGGYYWLSTHNGIARVSLGDLHACADGGIKQMPSVSYGLSDGVPSLQCSGGLQPASSRASDGRFWFPTSKGLVSLDPAHVSSNLLPPPVMIERLLVDDEVVAENPRAPKTIRIPPGPHRLEFQFTGLSYAAPEKVRFLYRMAGLEEIWTEGSALRRAYYSHIPPGDYRFEVRASNSDGVWSKDAAMLAFTLAPWFWQTWWFRVAGGVLTALAGGGIVWLDARRRMRRKLENIERQQAIERERVRIAKDIHDDLGAGLTRISLLSGSVSPDEVRSQPAAEVLSGIFSTTREMTQAMDEIVWAINPRHDTLDSLANYLGGFAQDFLAGTGVRCRLDLPMHLPQWRLDAEVRHNLFLAVKESLSNALRHAKATEIRVSLTVGDGTFKVEVEDNGCGIPVERLNASAATREAANQSGLSNMRQRLAQIGGRCDISNGPTGGSRVEFHVVLKQA